MQQLKMPMLSSSSTNNHEKRTQRPQHSRVVTVTYLLCIICFFCYGCAAQRTEPPGLPGPAGAAGGAKEPLGAHLFVDPPQYQQMTFDPKHRGGYNTSKCSNDLFNCWEIITPIEFCYHVKEKFVATTICDRMRVYCAYDGFDYDDYKYVFEIREYHCDYKGDQKTRRRSDLMHIMPWRGPPAPPSAAQLQALRLQLRGELTLAEPRPEPEPEGKATTRR